MAADFEVGEVGGGVAHAIVASSAATAVANSAAAAISDAAAAAICAVVVIEKTDSNLFGTE